MSIRELREYTGLSQNKFAAMFGIPAATVKDWEYGRRNPPNYVVNMIKTILEYKDEFLQKEGSRRITVSAPDALFKRIEAAAKERGLSKNAFILSLVHKELDE